MKFLASHQLIEPRKEMSCNYIPKGYSWMIIVKTTKEFTHVVTDDSVTVKTKSGNFISGDKLEVWGR